MARRSSRDRLRDGPAGQRALVVGLDVWEVIAGEGRALLADTVPDCGRLEAESLVYGEDPPAFMSTTNRRFPPDDPAPLGRLAVAPDPLLAERPGLAPIFLEAHRGPR